MHDDGSKDCSSTREARRQLARIEYIRACSLAEEALARKQREQKMYSIAEERLLKRKETKEYYAQRNCPGGWSEQDESELRDVEAEVKNAAERCAMADFSFNQLSRARDRAKNEYDLIMGDVNVNEG